MADGDVACGETMASQAISLSGDDLDTRTFAKLAGPIGRHLLAEGADYLWRAPAVEYRPMAAKECWVNTLALARKTGWQYACGLAMCLDGPPVQHAWAVDGEGFVVDLTWHGRQPGYSGITDYDALTKRQYLGITLPLERVDELLRQTAPLTVLEMHVSDLRKRR